MNLLRSICYLFGGRCAVSSAGSHSSSRWPVAISMTRTALPITSAGRFSPLGPLGMAIRHPALRLWLFQPRSKVHSGPQSVP
jgi:hypothetical protein